MAGRIDGRRGPRLLLEALESRFTPAINAVAQTGSANPLNPASEVLTPAPALGDLDGDGDLDLIFGTSGGTYRYFQNTGSSTSPAFVEQTGAANPLSGIDVGNFGTVALGDLDDDGKLDLGLGSTSGTVLYFRNTGSSTTPAFTQQAGASNPFNGIDAGDYSNAAFFDVDQDGDLDAVITAEFAGLRYYLNVGTSTSPSFSEQTGSDNPFSAVTGDGYTFPALGDMNGDGLADLLVGTEFLGAKFYLNTGTATAPIFTLQSGSANPFDGITLGPTTQVALGDLDADGDADTIAGFYSINSWKVVYYRTNRSPGLSAVATSVTFAENTVNAGAQRLDTDVTVSDPDGGNFQGGNLTVDYTGTTLESIGIGTSFGNGITISGTSVRFNGNAFGTVPSTGAGSGLAGNDLVISFNSAFATPAAVEALIESLTYRNTSDAPAAARTLAVTVNDGAGGSNSANLIVNVTPENDPPTFTSSAGTSATEDSPYSYAVSVSDPDAPAQNLTITGTTIPAWLTLTVSNNGTPTASATLTGTPTNADVGNHAVTIAVSDGVTSTQQSFTIVVANTNDSPTFTSTPTTAATEDQTYSYGIAVADVDPTSQNLTITGTTIPDWLTLNVSNNGTPTASATLTGTPTNADVGNHSVTITVSDGVTSTAQTFIVGVAAVNDAPLVTAPNSISFLEDMPVVLTGISVSDPDAGGGNLTLTLGVDAGTLAASSGAGVAVGGTSTSRTLTGTLASINAFLAAGGVTYIPSTAVASATLSVTADDLGNTGSGGSLQSTTAFVSLNPIPVNDAPSFSAGPNQTVGPRDPVTVVAWATGISPGAAEENGQSLAFEVTTSKDSLFAVLPSINPTTGTLTFTPSRTGSGTAIVTVRLIDDGGTANGGTNTSSTTTFTITVVRGAVGQNEVAKFAVGSGMGGTGTVAIYDADGSFASKVMPLGESGETRAAVADATGDGVPDLIAGTGPGVAAQVAVIDGVSGETVFAAFPFLASFTGGTYVAAGDIDGDGFADVAVSAGSTGGARIVVYNGRTGELLADFFGIDDPDFRGGARVAFGDLNGDGLADLIVAAGLGGGPRIAIFDGASLRPGLTPQRMVNDFFAFESTLRDGAYVSAGDFNGDGKADLVFGGGPTGGSRVRIVDGTGLLASGGVSLDSRPELSLANFFAGDSNARSGVRVTAKDLDGNSIADLVVGSDEGTSSSVRIYKGTSIRANPSSPAVDQQIDPFGEVLANGVYVG